MNEDAAPVRRKKVTQIYADRAEEARRDRAGVLTVTAGGVPALVTDYANAAIKIDIGINFFLARTEVLREVPWDETIRPIGGEHADWFLSMKEANKLVVYLPGANINTIEDNPDWRHLDYRIYRRRAQQGHELFLKKRGVKRYYGFDEAV